MACVRCGVAATAQRNPAGKVHLPVGMRAVRRRALPALLGRDHRPRVSPNSSRRPLLWDRRRGRFLVLGIFASRLFADRRRAGFFLRERGARWLAPLLTLGGWGSRRDPERFELIFPVTFQSPYGFRHTRYASLSISTGPVLECDRADRRSVNIRAPTSMNGCEKPFIHGLNRRFTVLNS